MHKPFHAGLRKSAALAATLLAAAGLASAATTVNITAQRATAVLPDGSTVPMWQFCGAAATGSAGTTVGGACPAAGTVAPWAPGPTIVLPVGDVLTVNLSNSLPVPTSLTIVGQIGGTDLGKPDRDPLLPHAPVTTTTWNVNAPALFTPPVQGARARSFGPEAGALGSTTPSAAYTWANSAGASTLAPGTYLYETGTHPSLQAPMGLYGVLIVTTAPVTTASTATPPVTTITTAGQAYPGTLPPGTNVYSVSYAGVPYDADATYLLSEIDPVQNAAVDAAAVAGTAETLISSDPKCLNAQQGGTIPCYPPAVNYRPTYFLVNGSPYNAANLAATAAVIADGAVTGNVLVRFVNAGSRLHVPVIPGLQMAVLSEDGHLAPGLPKVQSEVNLPPGRTADVIVNPVSNGKLATASTVGTAPTAYTDKVYAMFDRALSLASDNQGGAGMHGFLAIATAGTGATAALTNTFISGNGGPSLGAAPGSLTCTFAIAPNALASFSATVSLNTAGCVAGTATATAAATKGTVTWSGATFTYTPTTAPIAAADTFTVCNGAATPICNSVVLNFAAESASLTAPTSGPTYTSSVSSLYSVISRSSGVLAGFAASDGFPLSAALTGATNCKVTLNADGSFVAVPTVRTGTTCTFTYTATDTRNPASAAKGTANVVFPAPNGPTVTVVDALNNPANPNAVPPVTTPLTVGDYMWIIQEDRTFHNATPGVTPPYVNGLPPPSLAVSFHQSHMPVVAVGCTGPMSCGDGAGGQTYQKATAPLATYTFPADAVLDPTKHYYISVLPGDAANPFINAYYGSPTTSSNCLYTNTGNPNPAYLAPPGFGAPTDCGHTMGGAQLAPAQTTATISVEPNPLRPAALSIFIFEDNSPTNNDYDANEVGLGGFEIIVNDVGGRSGDPVGQVTFDAFNMPLTNSLLGVAGCPNETPAGTAALQQTNLVGVVYTCPDGDRPIASVTVNADGNVYVTTSVPHQFGSSVQGAGPTIDVTGLGTAALNGSFTVTIDSPTGFHFANPGGVAAGTVVLVPASAMARDATTYQLAGQALINNIMPGRYDVIAHPGAAREGAGQTWYQTSTLEGTPGQDAFTKANEPNYFQEFGPPGFHTFIGWLNPAHIADQNAVALAQSPGTTTTISGRVTSLHMSRTIMETLWDSASNAAIAQSNCFVALNQVGETGNDIAFTACKPDGTFTLPAVPAGQQYELVIWDQWLDQIIAFKNITATQSAAASVALGDIPVFSWFTRIEASVYLDTNGNGVRDANEPGIPLVPVRVHFRDGSISNTLFTDGNGNAVFNELFPLFNWYVVESDRARYTSTGVNVTVDAGGQPDCVTTNTSTGQGTLAVAGNTGPCALGSPTAGVLNSSYVWTDPYTGNSYGAVPAGASTSTNRIDPATTPYNGMFEGVQTFINQTQILNYGRRNFHPGENGGIQGMVVYSSTRGFDDPSLQVQNLWEPGIPRVTINLYREVANADGTTGYVFVNSTSSTSWDDWANTVTGADGKHYVLQADGTLLVPVTGATAPAAAYPSNGVQANMTCPGQDSNDPYVAYSIGTAHQFKCYDGFHMWNQVQPAVFDGAYFINTDANGKPLVPGNYMVEVVPPPGYEIVKEEDKNILIGDGWVAPLNGQQFGALTNIFILPDQASLSSAYNPKNPGNNNNTLGLDFTQGNALYPKCVGTPHQVPDFMSLFPISGQVAPFAGAMKPLCDRKEVVLNDQQTGLANFFLFTRTPRASHFTGLMLDDAAAEINAAAPDFGEKFAASYAPIAIRDFNGIEVSRVYTDQWGTYNGVIYSTWQVNVPNPAGYSPNMMVTCMNDPGPIPGPNGTFVTDPLYNPSYSNFCYTNPFMPGMTVYLDTPILPVAAFAAGYNPPDCALPATTPAIARVDTSSGTGPWLAAADTARTVTIKALGDVQVPNPNYQGPSGTTAPWNARTITRHYGFGASQGTGSVTVNGTPLAIAAGGWTDTQITATVPAGVTTGELVIVSGTGQKSVDAVTLNILGAADKAPVVVEPVANAATSAGNAHPIQDAIDQALPGDLIIVDAGSYPELVIMWKPVRLQGVGAAAVVISAAKYPTQKLQNWRPLVNRYFGVDTVLGNQVANSQVDPLPNQEITGGIVLLEPSVLATEEGAGITVLAKNPDSVDAVTGLPNANCGNTATSSYPDQVLFPPTSNTVKIIASATPMSYSNFSCAPSRIDGITVTGGDAGGGIYVNGWANGLEISNNRVYGNAGSFNGGVRVGVPFIEGLSATPVAADGTVFAFDVGLHIHHNVITNNGTVEANPGTVGSANSTGAGGGLSLCTGTDNYLVDYNFICGNYSAGDGGGIGHLGVSNNGTIAQNTIIFNQSYQQTSQVNGGGIVIEGEQGAVGGISLGTGNVTIDRNLIRGNFAQAGHGGGIRLQQVNGSDVNAAPNGETDDRRRRQLTGPWYQVTITNNMITNNVSGWGGGGISAVDALAVTLANNTIADNDSVGIVGSMIGSNPLNQAAPLTNTTGYPSPAGVSVDRTSAALLAGMTAANQALYQYSSPLMYNNILWQNRSFYFAITPQPLGVGGAVIQANTLCPSNTVADAYSHTCTPLPAQTTIGQCVGAPAYWDLGTTDDASVAAGSNVFGFALLPSYSVITSTAGYPDQGGNDSNDPNLTKPYCNGARANPAFIFEPGQPFLDPAAQNLTAGATLDEAGNYVDVRFGPLYLYDPQTTSTTSAGTVIGDYHLAGASGGAYNSGASIAGLAPTLVRDIDGDRRPQVPRDGSGVDIGADEFTVPGPEAGLTVSSTNLGNVQTGQVATTVLTVTNVGNPGGKGNLIVGNIASSNAYYSAVSNCPAAGLPANASCQITVTFHPTGAFALGGGTAEPTVISVASNGGNGTQTVNLSGTAWPPIATAVPTALAFGPVELGGQLSGTVTLTNSGYGPGYFASDSVLNPLGTAFSLGAGGTCAPYPAVVPVGGSCTVVVNFLPTAAGSFTGTLSVTGTANLGTTATVEQSVTGPIGLSGRGVTPRIALAPTGVHNFGAVRIGTSAGPFQWRLTNVSGVPLNLPASGIAFATGSSAEFSLAGTTCGTVSPLPPGASCTIDVTFAPTATGVVAGSVVVTSDAIQVATLPVSGTGANPPAINLGQDFGFGAITRTAGGATHTFTLSNTGGLPLTISSIGVASPNTAAGISYTVVPGNRGSCAKNGTVLAGGSCMITVRFVDTPGTATTATLTVTGVQVGTTAPGYTAVNNITGN